MAPRIAACCAGEVALLRFVLCGERREVVMRAGSPRGYFGTCERAYERVLELVSDRNWGCGMDTKVN